MLTLLSDLVLLTVPSSPAIHGWLATRPPNVCEGALGEAYPARAHSSHPQNEGCVEVSVLPWLVPGITGRLALCLCCGRAVPSEPVCFIVGLYDAELILLLGGDKTPELFCSYFWAIDDTRAPLLPDEEEEVAECVPACGSGPLPLGSDVATCRSSFSSAYFAFIRATKLC